MRGKLQKGFSALGIKFYGFLLLSIVILAVMMPLIASAPAVGQQPGGHLTITEVGVNFNDNIILITGVDFDFGPGPLTVFLDDKGDISSVCTPELVTIPQTIECDLTTVSGIPPDGDYLLTVANGKGQSQSDEYDLTIVRNPLTRDALVYTRTAIKGTADGGAAAANNKFVDVACDSGDILVAGGIELGGTTGGNVTYTAASDQDIADHITILENRPLGGATKWRVRAHETPVNGLGNRVGWFIKAWGVCFDTNP